MEAVILCGGQGTRAYPFTEYFPKPMMPICGTPILVHLMELYAHQGITRFVLAAGHRMEMLIDYFKGRFNDWHIDIVDTGADSDTGERVRRCAPYVGELFHVTYGDGLGDVDLCKLVDYHKSHGGVATVTAVPLRSQYGTIVFNESGCVSRFVEKPVIREHWINAGFFVFSKKVFDLWDGENLEREVLPNLVPHNELYTFQHEGFWKSMDTSRDQADFEALCRSGEACWIVDRT
ncbi:MAG: NTP transferase domain-containing protein [bacterium]|nr:NTP transferase domain-containing protein [bacterium]